MDAALGFLEDQLSTLPTVIAYTVVYACLDGLFSHANNRTLEEGDDDSDVLTSTTSLIDLNEGSPVAIVKMKVEPKYELSEDEDDDDEADDEDEIGGQITPPRKRKRENPSESDEL